MNKDGSYRQILRSTSIIGGASVLNILIGLIRIKVAALILGPSGIGLIGIFNNLIVTASSVAALGIGTVATRQIAEAAALENSHAVTVARRAVFWGTVVLASIGTFIFWLLRDALATHVLADSSLGTDVGWLALGVGLTVVTGSQSAVLAGLRRIGDLARVSVYAAVLSTGLGVGALLLWRENGLLLFLILVPMARFLFGKIYLSRLPALQAPPIPLRELGQHWNNLARLGIAFMLAGLATTLGQLMVRAMVQRELGTEALGHFEASWVISMTYIGFVLTAMGTDYYPRLTAAMHNHEAANRLVNEQTEVSLLLAGPLFLTMLGLAPWVVELLYSNRFAETATILRWQILGDILKVASWPLGFVILAKGDGKSYMISEFLAILVFVLFVWLGLRYFGLQATGIGFLVMYVVYLPLVHTLARLRTGFRWTRNNLIILGSLIVVGALITLVSTTFPLAGALLSVIAAFTSAVFAFGRLASIGNLSGRLGWAVQQARKLTEKLGIKHD